MIYDSSKVMAIYEGSNGDDTKALYAHLSGLGPQGLVAMNLFRAHKASGRAKVYRGGIKGKGSYRSMAYDRKRWSLEQLESVLLSSDLGWTWGWGIDMQAVNFGHVLYVDLPTGQVSFHSPTRGRGPDYPGKWDQQRGLGAQRICVWIGRLAEEKAA